MSFKLSNMVGLVLVMLMFSNDVAGAGTVCLPKVCSNYCISGYRLDGNGCKTCFCVDPCEVCHAPVSCMGEGEPGPSWRYCLQGYKCSQNLVCKSYPTLCLRFPCYRLARCVAVTCPKLKCLPCQSGFLRDEVACLTCECVDRCERVKCPSKQVCKEIQVSCIKAPCYNQGKCVPK